MTREPLDVDVEIGKTVEAIREARTSFKLLPVKRETYLGWEGYPGVIDFCKDLNISRNDAIKLLIILSGVRAQSDLIRDERVRVALRQLGKRVQ